MQTLIDRLGEWESVTLPGFERITLGQVLQDIDVAELEATIAKFPTYDQRLVVVEAVEAIAPPPAPAPEPEPIILTASPAEEEAEPAKPKKVAK
jgi:hypothetical protein